MKARMLGFSAGVLFLAVLAGMVLVGVFGGIERGTLDSVEYDYKNVLGGKQRIAVYLPPHYPQDAPYPARTYGK